MIHCPRCGAEIPSGSVFCMKCGTRIPALSQESPKGFHSSRLKRAAIPLGAIAVVSVLALAMFPGEQDPCRGVFCNDECRGTTLWKMKCVKGECVPDYSLEIDSEECGFVPPPETPEPKIDSDNDGILDSADDCYNPGCTMVNSWGCPLDSDGDGLRDCDDQCPYERGSASNNGCPEEDADGDGVPDDQDSCYNPDCNIVDSQGCPRDSDGDGIRDCDDDCPLEKGEKTNKGCPVEEIIIRIEITEVNYNAPGDDHDNPNGEWVRISNTGNQDVDMSGWRLYDDAYRRGTARDHVFVFPSGFILRAGQSVTVYTGQGINTGSQLYFGRPPGEYAAIWNNDGDCAYLVDDQGTLIDTHCW